MRGYDLATPNTERVGSATVLPVVPTILRKDGFRFFFFSNEGFEPAHIHVERGEGLAKFWLDPVELAESSRLKARSFDELDCW